jgi:hypothetical protein
MFCQVGTEINIKAHDQFIQATKFLETYYSFSVLPILNFKNEESLTVSTQMNVTAPIYSC